MPLDHAEQVVHAVCSDKYEPSTGECSLELYVGRNVSVSRLTVIQLFDQWRIMAATVQRLPGRRLEKLSELGVGQIIQIAKSYRPKEKPDGIELTVEDDPKPHNSAHAEIRGKITGALSRKLVDAHVLHASPEGFDPESIPRLEA